MLPIIGWVLGGLGTMWAWDKITGTRQPIVNQRRYDYSAAVMEPSMGLRVLRHDLRPNLHSMLKNVVAMPATTAEGQPIPYWFAVSQRANPQQTDLYTAVGAAVQQGKWIAMRLDSVQNPVGGLLVSGPRAMVEELCKGDAPFCLIARPKPAGAPQSAAAAAPEKSQEAMAQTFASFLAAMTPEQRKDLGKALILGADKPAEKAAVSPDYAGNSNGAILESLNADAANVPSEAKAL